MHTSEGAVVGTTWVRVLFAVAGVYDLALGLGFLAVGPGVFEAAGVPGATCSSPPSWWPPSG